MIGASDIDALLPQTQCTRCGYTGCLPYAEAIARGEADINQCPPGGTETIVALRSTHGSPDRRRSTATTAWKRRPRVAFIDEERCIGCTKCLPPCPVDAIVGAPRRMHTVIAELCTGCELCVAPCPVDCIIMIPLLASPLPSLTLPPAQDSRAALRRAQRTHGAPRRASAPRHSRPRNVARGRRHETRAMNPQKRREIFERFRAANPHPTTELEYETPFELLRGGDPVGAGHRQERQCGDAQAVSGCQHAGGDCRARRRRLEKYIRTIGLWKAKAKNVIATATAIAASSMAAKCRARAKRSKNFREWVAKLRTWC